MAEDDSGERTLDPTQKKLDQALERGDVAKSQELTTWFVLGAGDARLLPLRPGRRARPHAVLARPPRQCRPHAGRRPGRCIAMARTAGGRRPARPSACRSCSLIVASAAGNAFQHRLVFSLEPMTPKLSKISPLAGFKRLFGQAAWVNFGKGLAKIVDRRRGDGVRAVAAARQVAALVSADIAALAPLPSA